MSKSVKLKNDTYLDSSSIVIKNNDDQIISLDKYLTLSNIITNITENQDLDDYRKYGWYKWDAGVRPTNSPKDGCVMLVIPHTWGCIQFCIYFNINDMNIYYRKKVGWGSWSGWCKLVASSI